MVLYFSFQLNLLSKVYLYSLAPTGDNHSKFALVWIDNWILTKRVRTNNCFLYYDLFHCIVNLYERYMTKTEYFHDVNRQDIFLHYRIQGVPGWLSYWRQSPAVRCSRRYCNIKGALFHFILSVIVLSIFRFLLARWC